MDIRTTGYFKAIPPTPRSIRIGMTLSEARDLIDELEVNLEDVKENDQFIYFTIEGEAYE
jgi:hypothetical protein